MRLMRLAPETVRLRRIARAWAAGECSLQDYREARREVIANFSMSAFDDDDTRPRWDEQTLRGVGDDRAGAGATGLAIRTRAASAEVLVGIDSQANKVEDASVGSASLGRNGWLLLAILVAIMGALSLCSGLALADTALVPPVSQRDPNPASSPRLPVRDVRLSAASWEALPAVDRGAIEAVVQSSLEAIRARNTPAAHGFTPGELDEVGRFLRVLGVHEGGDLSAADARDLSALIRDQKERRGISVLELEEIAHAVQTRLRADGYFLAVAYVPSQPLREGVVELDVLPGRLGDIVVDGGDSEPVTRHFANLLGQPVTMAAVEQRLYQLNTMPGFQAQASFEPGQEVGETRLRLNVLEQRAWIAAVRVDNHGDAATGDERLLLDASWLNPLGIGDRLDVGLLATVDPANQTYGHLGYEAPVAGGFTLRGQIGNNDFSWEPDTDLDGEGIYFDLTARRNLLREGNRSLDLALSAARHELDWDSGVKQSVSTVSGSLAGGRTWEALRVAGDGTLKLTAGHIGDDTFVGQDENFWALEMDMLAWRPVHLPLLVGEQKLSLRLQGQLADSYLPAPQRFALSGPHRSRSFDRSDLETDRGIVASIDLRFPLQLGELVLFADGAYGQGRGDGTSYWRRAADAGLGWDAELSRQLTTRLSWARPFVTQGSGAIDDDGSRFYWSLEYAH